MRQELQKLSSVCGIALRNKASRPDFMLFQLIPKAFRADCSAPCIEVDNLVLKSLAASFPEITSSIGFPKQIADLVKSFGIGSL